MSGNNQFDLREGLTSVPDRRKFMKTVGIGATGLIGMTGTAAANDHSDKNDHSWGLRVYDAMDGYNITVSWEWEKDGFGTDPDDGVGIYWDNDKWEILNADYGHSNEVSFDRKSVKNNNEGVSWFHDQDDAQYNYDAGTNFSATTKISPQDGHETYPVYAEYHHTWDDDSITAVGIQSGGFKIEWENEGKSWKKADDKNVDL